MKIEDITKLRQKSGLGLMECKQALEEANGDLELAEVNLRKQGLSNMDGRADREASEGAIFVKMNETKCVILEMNCETDFTARSEVFLNMGHDLCNMAWYHEPGLLIMSPEMIERFKKVGQATKENIVYVRGRILEGERFSAYVHHDGKTGVVVQSTADADLEVLHKICLHIASVDPAPICVNDGDVSAELLLKEREIAEAQVANKPENIVAKIVKGKLNKFLDKVVLMRQPLVMDTKTKVKDLGVEIVTFVKFRVGE